VNINQSVKKILTEEYNNSIHNWELYHKLKKSEFEITNKLKFVNENKQEKIKNLFDSMMEDYGKLVEIEREYDDFETGDIYQAYVYYKDPELDWEDDEYVFKTLPVDNSDDYNLEYHAWELSTISGAFGKQLFEKMLKPWFEKTYKLKITSVYPT
jgi:hypothetical protein